MRLQSSSAPSTSAADHAPHMKFLILSLLLSLVVVRPSQDTAARTRPLVLEVTESSAAEVTVPPEPPLPACLQEEENSSSLWAALRRFSEYSSAVYEPVDRIYDYFREADGSTPPVAVRDLREVDLRYFLHTPRRPKVSGGDVFQVEANGQRQLLVVRGTANMVNVMSDVTYTKAWDAQIGCYVHAGFLEVTNALFRDVLGLLGHPKDGPPLPLVLSGHSLGGAAALLLGAKLAAIGYPVKGIVTFGQPMVTNAAGSQQLKSLLRSAGATYVRVANEGDPVTRMPPFTVLDCMHGFYVHFGHLVLLHDDATHVAPEAAANVSSLFSNASSASGARGFSLVLARDMESPDIQDPYVSKIRRRVVGPLAGAIQRFIMIAIDSFWLQAHRFRSTSKKHSIWTYEAECKFRDQQLAEEIALETHYSTSVARQARTLVDQTGLPPTVLLTTAGVGGVMGLVMRQGLLKARSRNDPAGEKNQRRHLEAPQSEFWSRVRTPDLFSCVVNFLVKEVFTYRGVLAVLFVGLTGGAVTDSRLLPSAVAMLHASYAIAMNRQARPEVLASSAAAAVAEVGAKRGASRTDESKSMADLLARARAGFMETLAANPAMLADSSTDIKSETNATTVADYYSGVIEGYALVLGYPQVKSVKFLLNREYLSQKLRRRNRGGLVSKLRFVGRQDRALPGNATTDEEARASSASPETNFIGTVPKLAIAAFSDILNDPKRRDLVDGWGAVPIFASDVNAPYGIPRGDVVAVMLYQVTNDAVRTDGPMLTNFGVVEGIQTVAEELVGNLRNLGIAAASAGRR